MIKTRLMASAFIFNKDKMLMMKRAPGRAHAPGLWAGVGGHLEQYEINTPAEACYREIFEETGITREELKDLRLKYITVRIRQDELRIQYVYFAATEKMQLQACEEGELHWIDMDKVLGREMYPTTRFILEHYFAEGKYSEDVLVGTLSRDGDKPAITWSELEDWE